MSAHGHQTHRLCVLWDLRSFDGHRVGVVLPEPECWWRAVATSGREQSSSRSPPTHRECVSVSESVSISHTYWERVRLSAFFLQ